MLIPTRNFKLKVFIEFKQMIDASNFGFGDNDILIVFGPATRELFDTSSLPHVYSDPQSNKSPSFLSILFY